MITWEDAVAVLYSALAWLFGGFDALIGSLVCLMAIDYISGLLVGYKEKTLNSKRGFEGILKKTMILLILASATIVSRVVDYGEIRDIVGIFYCTMEILSVLENGTKLGVPIPNKLKSALEQCRDDKNKRSE